MNINPEEPDIMAKAKITEVMMDDKTIDASKEIAMVFSIANTLRGDGV